MPHKKMLLASEEGDHTGCMVGRTEPIDASRRDPRLKALLQSVADKYQELAASASDGAFRPKTRRELIERPSPPLYNQCESG